MRAPSLGLVAAFAAREVFVSTESIVNATGPTDDSAATDTTTKPLPAAMQADRYTCVCGLPGGLSNVPHRV